MINIGFNYPPFACYPSSQNAALYFNSMCNAYDMQYMEHIPVYYQPVNLQYSYFPQYSQCKSDTEAERSTADSEESEQEIQKNNGQVKVEEQIKKQEFIHTYQPVIQNVPKNQKKPKKEKSGNSLKKNTQSNVINNILSYVCSQMKSHKAIKKLLETPERKKIFYIFMNNLKRLNNKYLNRKNVAALLQLEFGEPHERTLSKSVKRLLILPIPELKIILRRLIYDYLRDEISLVPILTSKKINRSTLKEHFEKRRQLLEYFFKKRQ